jgi:ABC-type Fe3+-hydroxamate transport system substrate-binding protein
VFIFAALERAEKPQMAQMNPDRVPSRRLWPGVLIALAIGLCGWWLLPWGGESVPEPAPPGAASELRIVTLSPALAIIVRDLGLAWRVVGRDGYDMVLPKSVPVCGNLGQIDYEQLARVKPTHILMQLGALDPPRRLGALAAEHGWTVRDFPLLTLKDIRAATRELGVMLRAEPNAASLLARMDEAWSRHDGLDKAGRILMLESVSPPAALGPGSWHHELLEAIGGTPAFREGKPFVQMDAEDVLRLAPDGIIVFLPRTFGTPGPDTVRGPEAMKALGRLAELDIPAVKRAHVAVITDPLCLTPSTAMIDVAGEMAGILNGWAE